MYLQTQNNLLRRPLHVDTHADTDRARERDREREREREREITHGTQFCQGGPWIRLDLLLALLLISDTRTHIHTHSQIHTQRTHTQAGRRTQDTHAEASRHKQNSKKKKDKHKKAQIILEYMKRDPFMCEMRPIYISKEPCVH